MQRTASVVAILLAVSNAFGDPDDVVLLKGFYRFRITDSTVSQAEQLAPKTDAEASDQIQAVVQDWKAGRLRSLRSELDQQFGPRARIAFQQFVEEFTRAEKQMDEGYLRELSAAAGLQPVPADYDALARVVLQTQLQNDMETAADFLSEIETWLHVRSKNENAPPLDTWLRRNEIAQIPTRPAPIPPPARPRNPLRDAEAPAADFVPPDSEAEAGLATFSSARSERRAKALEEAQAGMQQVAAERDAAEREYAAAKVAAAQAEAEAMKKHAEKLAAAEQEALEQRKNSWSGRLKQIVSSTLGAAGGAFFGGIGSRAGEAAANAVFKE